MDRPFGLVALIMVIACFARIQAAPSISSEPSCSSGKLDLVLVVDVSGSNQRRFETNRDAALSVARSMPIGWDRTKIAVIQYSNLAIMKHQFSDKQSLTDVNDTIFNLEWVGGVAMGAEAMDLAMIQFRDNGRNDADRVIILFSDGNSLNKWHEVQATAERLKYSNSKIFTVSLGGNTYEPELKEYIGQSNGTIVRSQSELEMLKKQLLQYTVPACRKEEIPFLASKLEGKHTEENVEESNNFEKPADFSNEKTTSAEHTFSTTQKKTTSAKHNTTRHEHTSSGSKGTTSFVAFPKKSSTKTTSRTTRKPITRTSTFRTTHHASSMSNDTTTASPINVTIHSGPHVKMHNSPHNTGLTRASNRNSTSSNHEIVTTSPKSTTTTPDVFDPVARQQAIEKMIDKAVHS